MSNFRFVKLLTLSFILLASSHTFAARLKGDYCTYSAAGGRLFMRFIPTDKSHGTLTVFYSGPSGRECMGGERAYTLDGKILTDVNGLSGSYDGKTVHIDEPANWSGPWAKELCGGKKPQDPCKE